MRDGYIYWHEGSGRHALRHRAAITSVSKLNVAGGEGIRILCEEPGCGTYEIYYGYASKAHQHFITIYRDTDATTTEVLLMK